MSTADERAGDIQRLVAEEARRLDPASREHLAAALWLAVEGAQDTLAAVVTSVVDQVDEPDEEVQRGLLARITLAVARLERLVAVAENVSPPPRHGPHPGHAHSQ